jgi:1-phosphofructokinase family hexose kinase
MADLAVAEGLSADWYWLEAGETRTCMLITHDSGDATVINEPGEAMSNDAWADFAAHVARLARQARAVAFCGSLMPGVEPGRLSTLARSLAAAGQTVYLDTSAAALAAALAQPAGLCLKVNRAELAVGLNQPVDYFSTGPIIEVGQELLGRGAALVVVTLGDEGVLAIAAEGCWQASAPPVQVVNSAGSGDAFLGGLAVARLQGQDLETALRVAVACGAANAATIMPGQFEWGTVEALLTRVKVKRLTFKR